MKIYLININDVSENELHLWYNCMSNQRKKEADNIKNKSKRISSIVSDHLCRKAVSGFSNMPENEIVFSKNEHGKPFANGTNAHFSVSHSGDLVICAVSEKEIGTDIEKSVKSVSMPPKDLQRNRKLTISVTAPTGFLRYGH